MCRGNLKLNGSQSQIQEFFKNVAEGYCELVGKFSNKTQRYYVCQAALEPFLMQTYSKLYKYLCGSENEFVDEKTDIRAEFESIGYTQSIEKYFSDAPKFSNQIIIIIFFRFTLQWGEY